MSRLKIGARSYVKIAFDMASNAMKDKAFGLRVRETLTLKSGRLFLFEHLGTQDVACQVHRHQCQSIRRGQYGKKAASIRFV